MNRIFITGSEWLFYKLYTGLKTADSILTETIKPVSEQLLAEGVIDAWFFIRYADPKFHLRVRFHHAKSIFIEKSIHLIHNSLMPLIEDEIIWKVANDTYYRELERYGFSLIELTERLFFHESTMIVGILSQLRGDEGEIIRWLIGLRAIDETLDLFEYNELQKYTFLAIIRDEFGMEFGMDKNLKQQLSDKYRTERKAIEELLNRDNDTTSEMAPLFDLLLLRGQSIRPIVKELKNLELNNRLEVPIDNLLKSYLHMMVNRLFKSKQRLHELVLYDFLWRYYRSQLAREKQISTP